MKQKNTPLVELHQIILAPRDGAMERPLSRSLSHLGAGILDRLTDTWKSVPNDAQYLQLSIIVSAIGEPPTSESLTSITQPGHSSPRNPFAEASSESPSDPYEQGQWPTTQMVTDSRFLESERGPAAETPSSPTPLSRAGSPLHDFVPKQPIGKPAWADGNCANPNCGMPRSAWQHEPADA